MDFKIIEDRQLPDYHKEMEKLLEELSEVQVALNNKDIDNFYEEFFDIIQVLLHLAVKKGINVSRETLLKELEKHNKKLINRGWKLNDI